MKIAIARPEHAPGWEPYPVDLFATPLEIRIGLRALLVAEDDGIERRIVTMNRTVLDEVGGTKEIDYADVVVGPDLVPLLEIRDARWLCHFALGDLLEELVSPKG